MATPSQMPTDRNFLSGVNIWSTTAQGDGKILNAEGTINGRKVQIEVKVPNNFNNLKLEEVLNDSFVGKSTKTSESTKFELKNKNFKNVTISLYVDSDTSDSLKQIKKDKTSLNRLHQSATTRAFQTLKDAYANVHTTMKEVTSKKAPSQVFDRESKLKAIEEYCRNPASYTLEFDPKTGNLSVITGKSEKSPKTNRETVTQILALLDQKITEEEEAYDKAGSDKIKQREVSDKLKSNAMVLNALIGNRLPFQDIIKKDDTLFDQITLLFDRIKK